MEDDDRPGTSSLLDEAEKETRHRKDGEDDEQNLADAHGAGGNSAKAEDGSDQGDDEEDDGVVQQGGLRWLAMPVLCWAWAAAAIGVMADQG